MVFKFRIRKKKYCCVFQTLGMKIVLALQTCQGGRKIVEMGRRQRIKDSFKSLFGSHIREEKDDELEGTKIGNILSDL